MTQPPQQQTPPGTTAQMTPKPDHGEESYKGRGGWSGKRAVITGADSGIGKAVAIAFAREGADVLISYLNEAEDATEQRTGCSRRGARPSWSRRPVLARALPRGHRHGRPGAQRDRHPRLQCRLPDEPRKNRGDPGRGVGLHDRHEPQRLLSPHQGRAAPHGVRRLDHRARRRSTTSSPLRSCFPTRSPRRASRTWWPASPSRWPSAASAPTASHPDRSGRR